MVMPSGINPIEEVQSVSSFSFTNIGRTDVGAPEDEPVRTGELAMAHPCRATAAPFVKSAVPALLPEFRNTSPLARSKSAPSPPSVSTGTRSRTTSPPSLMTIESNR